MSAAVESSIFLAALALDLLWGEVPARLHPVVWMGRSGSALAKRAPRTGLRSLVAGALIVALVVGGSVGTALLVAAVAAENAPLGWCITVVALSTTFSVGLLLKEVSGLRHLLERGDIVAARLGLPRLCSRSPEGLEESDLAGAGVSSAVENLCDSIVAPWVFWMLFGLPGAFAYRALNTLDATIGYRGNFERIGKTAARLDDVFNWVPARLSAVLLVLAGGLISLPWREGIRIGRRDHGLTPSPNGGWTMATTAGLLAIRLEKPASYVLNADGRAPDNSDLRGATRLVAWVSGLAATVVVMAAMARGWWSR